MGVLDQLVGESRAIAAVRDQVARLLRAGQAPGRRLPPILVLGETGTGKGLLAGAIHRASGRASRPFVDVNCAAIPETLLEAELFGFERGAFTDARQAKPGLFQAAGGGTIFLDEIGLMPLGLQAKLLKVIEERAVRRLGSTRSEPVDVCVIAATSEDLEAAVKEGRFRADLYHRLAVVALALPPLRERGRDVLLLAEHFLARVCEDYGLPPRALADDAREALLAYPWPGNVRELHNALERAALLSDEPRLSAAALALPAPAGPARPRATGLPAPASPDVGAAPAGTIGAGADAGGELARERQALLDALRAAGWNFTHAAAALGVPRNTLRYRAERLGLTPEGPPSRRRGGRPPRAVASGAIAGPAAGEAQSPAMAAAGAPAAGPAPSPAPETRRVTLLLARLVAPDAGGRPGATVPEPASAAAASTGAWGAVRALEATAAKIGGFGGRVEQRGEGEVLAAFGLERDEGAPRHGACAALAVAALAERARAQSGGLAPGVTVALHVAPVPVEREGGRLRVAAAALAGARGALDALASAARPGTVVASEAAARFLARRFELAALPPPAAAPGASRVLRQVEPGRTRFVGRARELRLLLERFELAEGGQGQVAMIVGEPGIGKSRLLHELRRRLGARATWVEGHALSFGQAMPFHPVIDMLRRVFRIDDGDPEAAVAEKIEHGVARLGSGLEVWLPYLRYLLSVDPGDPAVRAMDPKRRAAAIVTGTHLLLERGAELRPHVLVLEDLHWCDAATEEWIARLVDRVAAHRVLVLLTFRPGYRPPFAPGSFHTSLALAALSGEESARVAGGLLGVEDLPPALRALVVDRAEGNPFFIEELVRSLEEQGALRRAGDGLEVAAALDEVPVPGTIEEIILARVQRLDGRLQHLLQVASVIGRTVRFPLLQAVSGLGEEALADDLRRLQAAEFLREVRVHPEQEHVFKHALTQDVAYATVAPAERRALHARIAGAMERLYAGRLDEHVERLAYHALRGELWEEAVRYSRRAGAKAFDRSANREAAASFEQACDALARLPERPDTLAEAVDVRLVLRSALLQLGEIGRIDAALREAERIATALGDRPRLAWVWTYMTIGRLFAGDPVEAQATGERALALAEAVGDVALRATARTPLAHACHERGDHRRALALLAETIEALSGDLLRQRLGQGMPPALYARNISALCRAELGDVDEAARLAVESGELARSLDLPFGLVLARIALGHGHLVAGRLDEAAAALDDALALIEARGIPTWYPWAAAERGYALALAGRAGEGAALLACALDRAVALPILFGHSRWVAWLAHALWLAGRADDARRRGEEALALTRGRGERGHEAWALRVLAEIEAGCGNAARAAALRGEARALADALGLRPLAGAP